MVEENPFARLFKKPTISAQLAVLQPGTRRSPIKITLTSADSITSSYECISYDRSQDHSNVEIEVGGQQLAVPRPLEAALRAFRRTDQPRTLWADLLVGSSAEERSSQAAVMKAVLENSDQTMVWLGTGDEQTAAAFDILQIMANRCQQAYLHVGFPERQAQATPKQCFDLLSFFLSKTTDELHPTNEAVWEAVNGLLSPAYFRSVYSIPEIVLAKKVVVICGISTMEWGDYISAGVAALSIMTQQLGMPISQNQMEIHELIHGVEVAKCRHGRGETVELLPMIQSARMCSITDPRDILFSMLPIITQSARTRGKGRKETPPTVDYKKSTQDVFTEAARYIVHERQDLLLWWPERPPRGRRVEGLPSWVPDWSTPLNKDVIKVSTEMDNGMRIWWEHINPKAKRICVDDNNVLHVQAHALDRVVSVSPIFTQENCRRLCMTEWQALPTNTGESEDEKMQRMFRTLILNQAEVGATLSQLAAPHEDMWASFQSVVAEEKIMELAGCTLEQMMTQPEIAERMKQHPACAVFGPATGRSEEFEGYLRAHAIGRRFFCTQSGKTGMTAVEQLPEGARPVEGQPPVPNFDAALANDIGRMMLGGYQNYLAQRNPHMAGIISEALNGNLPGQAAPGVRAGDLVVALVGGFQPYILRPAGEYNIAVSVDETLESISRYHFVGDCYLHGVMDGEPFRIQGRMGTQQWKQNVKLVDITII